MLLSFLARLGIEAVEPDRAGAQLLRDQLPATFERCGIDDCVHGCVLYQQ